MFYKLGQQIALFDVGLLKEAQISNPGLAAQMRTPTWGLQGPAPEGFKRELPAAGQPIAPGPAAGAGAGTGQAQQAAMPQKATDPVTPTPAPGPAAAPGPGSPFRGPDAGVMKPPSATFKPATPTAKDLGIPGKATAQSLGIPGASPF